jgi:hypothetical protein
MARKVEIGTEKYTQVFAEDERGAGNANHFYTVCTTIVPTAIVGQVQFQKGAIKESGVNGVMNENAIALTKLEEALLRTMDRERRGVEGTSII